MSTKKVLSQNAKSDFFSHHANLLIGAKEYWQGILVEELKKFLVTDNLKNSPDIWWQNYESFGIKEAHALIEMSAKHSFGNQGRFFILEISSMTPEAQNALLKTFEEPSTKTHFFVIARSVEIFLPTLKSRMAILNQLGGLTSKLMDTDYFLKLDLPDRLDFIQKEFLKNKDKPKSEIIDFVADLEKTFYAKINMRKITKNEELALHELAKCQRYLQNPRSSNRLILEHLVLVIPIT